MQDRKVVSFRDYLRILFKHKLMIVSLVLVTMITVNIGLEMRTPMHSASVQMLISGMKRTEAEHYRGVIAGSIIGGHSVLVQSNAVVERVVEVLKLYKRPLDYEKRFASPIKKFFIDYQFGDQLQEFNELPEKERYNALFQNAVGDLRSNISVQFSDESPVLNISITDFSPREAVRIANVLSRSYVIFDLEQQALEFELEYGEKNLKVIQVKNYIEDFKKLLDAELLPDSQAIGPASIKIIQQARSSQAVTYKPSKSVARLLSIILSLSLGFLLAFGLEFWSDAIKSPNDIESSLGLTFLGSIPRIRSGRGRLIQNMNPKKTQYLQSYQNLSNQIYAMMKGRDKKVALITDAEGSVDTPLVVANLGIWLSNEAHHKILIIDSNLRSPSINNIFGIPNDVGVYEMLEGTAGFHEAIHEVQTNLHIMPSGKTLFNPAPLLQSAAMANIIKDARDVFDLVFIIAADLKDSMNALFLSSFTDGVILIINEGHIKQHTVKRAIAPFEQKEIDIIGAVINNRRYFIPEMIYKRT